MQQFDKVWIVDDDKSIRWVLEKALQKSGIETESFSSANESAKNPYRPLCLKF